MGKDKLDSVGYWETRAEQRIIYSEREANKMLIDIRKLYSQAQKEIEKEIFAFYGRYAQETGLTLEEIQRRLSPTELLSAKEDIEMYYREVKRLGGYSPETEVYLRSLSARAYMSRLEELKYQMTKRVENLYRLENINFESNLMKLYEDTYYRTNFDIQKGFGFSMPFTTLNEDMLKKIISQKWIGDNFSDRIWTDKNKLLTALETKFSQGVALGHNPRKIASTLKGELDTKYSNCERLARTEFNHAANQASLDSYKEYSSTPKYQIVATLDSRTSEICQEMDGKVFEVSEAQEGVNFPLFHPNCYDNITEVYTKDGWKLFKDCKDDDLYYSMNPDTLVPEWLKANKRISYKYNGDMIEFDNHTYNLCVTPNHQMIMKYNKEDGANRLRFVTARECPKTSNSIPRGINWVGEYEETAQLGNLRIPMDLYLKFMAWWLSDGSCTKVKGKNSYRIKIAQKTYIDLMYNALKKLPLGVHKYEDGIMFSDYPIGKELAKYGKCNEKFIPEIIKQLPPEQIEVFLYAYVLADGHEKVAKNWKGGNFRNEICFFTTSDRLAGDLGELILKVGGRPSFTLQKSKGKIVKWKNEEYTCNHNVWVIRWCRNTWTKTENLKRNLIPYNDYVYCVELSKYHTLLVRRNGKISWCGNCRTTTIPYFEEDEIDKLFAKAKRLSDGGYIDADTTYNEWKEQIKEKNK